MSSETILLADDDALIVDALGNQLRLEGYDVVTALDGKQALDAFAKAEPDLVLLDVMMPEMNGWDVCRAIRRRSHVPILMLTARDDEFDRVLGLELGADDYVTKPFSARGSVARIRANLRRVAVEAAKHTNGDREKEADLVVLGHVTIDRRRYVIVKDETPVHLSQREYDLLIALLEADGAVIKRQTLIDQVWGEEWIGDTRTLDVHIRWLREKLEKDATAPQMILTTRGVGYRLTTADEITNNG